MLVLWKLQYAVILRGPARICPVHFQSKLSHTAVVYVTSCNFLHIFPGLWNFLHYFCFHEMSSYASKCFNFLLLHLQITWGWSGPWVTRRQDRKIGCCQKGDWYHPLEHFYHCLLVDKIVLNSPIHWLTGNTFSFINSILLTTELNFDPINGVKNTQRGRTPKFGKTLIPLKIS